MNDSSLLEQEARKLIHTSFPLPKIDKYGLRLEKFFDYGRKDLSLAKIMEAHFDAIAILTENDKTAKPNCLYAVWASEIPGQSLHIEKKNKTYYLSGKKMFCSGTTLVDRVLITAEENVIDIDLYKYTPQFIIYDEKLWITQAFARTHTYAIQFNKLPFTQQDIAGPKDWYINRPGFWQGALGPAACWAGGACSLVDYAKNNSRHDSHTLAHLAAMEANIFTMQTLLAEAGRQIDLHPDDSKFAESLALKIRHSIEQLCSDTLRRFGRAYGPFPLSCDEKICLQYQELDLFLKQHHAERDLEKLGTLIKNSYEKNN